MTLFDELWEFKNKLPETLITAITKRDVKAIKHTPKEKGGGYDSEEYIIPAGTRVRIWMISRFGDVGIAEETTLSNGYRARVGSYPEELGLPVRNPGEIEDWLEEVTVHTGTPAHGHIVAVGDALVELGELHQSCGVCSRPLYKCGYESPCLR